MVIVLSVLLALVILLAIALFLVGIVITTWIMAEYLEMKEYDWPTKDELHIAAEKVKEDLKKRKS